MKVPLVNLLTGRPIWPALESALQALVERYQNVYHAPDPGPLLITMAVYTAFRLPGDPLWLMLVGGPSSGKTELLNLLAPLPLAHSASTITPAGLLSATSKKDRSENASGGLLREIGDSGLLVLKDFTTILSMSREARQQILAALREIHDGKWIRVVGTDGGRTLPWRGKMGLIAACTTSIDDHHSVMAAMGERFLLSRLPKSDGDEQEAIVRRVFDNSGSEVEMRLAIAEAVRDFFDRLNIPDSAPRMDEEYARCLEGLATLVARCRSAITRDGIGREIVNVHDPESPARLGGQLRRLDAGLAVIGVPLSFRYWLLRKVALDCIPPLRLRVFLCLARSQKPVQLAQLITATGYPKVTTWRALEELKMHGLVQSDDGENGWQLRDEWRERWSRFPKRTKC